MKMNDRENGKRPPSGLINKSPVKQQFMTLHGIKYQYEQ
jgi:hypothetical protein